jgi:hypothetical protein
VRRRIQITTKNQLQNDTWQEEAAARHTQFIVNVAAMYD